MKVAHACPAVGPVLGRAGVARRCKVCGRVWRIERVRSVGNQHTVTYRRKGWFRTYTEVRLVTVR